MISVLILLAAGVCLAGGECSSPGESLSTPEAAVERALIYTGFSKTQELSLSNGNAEAMKATMEGAMVNLMKDKMGSDSIWQVTLKDVRFSLLDRGRPFREQQHRDFTVWLDAVTGRLIRIHSKLPDTVGCIKRKPYYIDLERRLIANRDMDHYGYPDSLPAYSLFDVMQTVVAEPFNKKEITVYYVIQSRMKSEPKPVWIIHIGGIPPFEARQLGSKTDYSLNHMQKIIDPSNGGMLSGLFYGSLGILETDTTGDSTKY